MSTLMTILLFAKHHEFELTKMELKKHPMEVGLTAAIKPLLSHSTTGEFNSPPQFSRPLPRSPSTS
eukprot:9131642-Pyramimonas_sp.AAC.1